ncbi:hypothetical protein OQA88_10505 [Cercophora sp. LCS_1]
MRFFPGPAVLGLVAAPLALSAPGLDLALVAKALNYEDEVCHPVVESASDTVPPCLELVTIETVCTPNGTSPLALKAHQQCMCNGSFFAEWPYCLQCLFIHGLRSERDVAYYKSVLSTASSELCGAATPSAEFASIFSSAQVAVAYPTTGNTISSDQAVGQTAVSLYFTATTYQGPGRITGAATAATQSVLYTAPKGTVTHSHAIDTAGSGSTSGTRPSSTNTAPAGSAATTRTSASPRRPTGTGGGLLLAALVVLASIIAF